MVAVVYALYSIRPIMQHFYPYNHQDIILEQAQIHDLDPHLIAALIHVESKWNPTAVSPKGAAGLMQLMPDTAQWIAKQIGLVLKDEELFSPQINIMLGCWYLAYLRKQFPSFAAALAAYNGGQGNVRQWLSEQIWDGRYETVHNIPFGETRSYMRKVTYTWSIYKKIYDRELINWEE